MKSQNAITNTTLSALREITAGNFAAKLDKLREVQSLSYSALCHGKDCANLAIDYQVVFKELYGLLAEAEDEAAECYDKVIEFFLNDLARITKEEKIHVRSSETRVKIKKLFIENIPRIVDGEVLENLVKTVFSSESLDLIFKEATTKNNSSESRFKEIEQLFEFMDKLETTDKTTSYRIARDSLFNNEKFIAICGPNSTMRSPEVIWELVEKLLALDITDAKKSDLLSIVLISHLKYDYDLIGKLDPDILLHNIEGVSFKLGDFFRGIVNKAIVYALRKETYRRPPPRSFIEGHLFALYLLGLTRNDFDGGLSNEGLYGTIQREFFTLRQGSFGGQLVGIHPLGLYDQKFTSSNLKGVKERLKTSPINSFFLGHFKFMEDLENCLKKPEDFQLFFARQMKLLPESKDRINFILDYVEMKTTSLGKIKIEDKELLLSTFAFCRYSLLAIDSSLHTKSIDGHRWLSRNLKLRRFPKLSARGALGGTLTHLFSLFPSLHNGLAFKTEFNNDKEEYVKEFSKYQYFDLASTVCSFNDGAFFEKMEKEIGSIEKYTEFLLTIPALATKDGAQVIKGLVDGDVNALQVFSYIKDWTIKCQKENKEIKQENVKLQDRNGEAVDSFAQVTFALGERDKTIETLRTTNREQQRQVQTLQVTNRKQQKQVEILQATNGEQQEQVQKLQTEYRTLEATNERLVKALEAAHKGWKLKEKEKKKEHENLQKGNNALIAEQGKLKDALKKSEDKFEDLQRVCSGLRTAIGKLSKSSKSRKGKGGQFFRSGSSPKPPASGNSSGNSKLQANKRSGRRSRQM